MNRRRLRRLLFAQRRSRLNPYNYNALFLHLPPQNISYNNDLFMKQLFNGSSFY
uniref:Uncharacterized protein n=1 Tax=Rhizophagus irregularis (strain DAOM 181602 / DAOM 197198 / MUCL 43194) TaxID=747089 RepID=U9SUY9_RHIID